MVSDRSPIDSITDFIPNPQQPHVATVLLVDTSGSMSSITPSGKSKIDELNEGLTLFRDDVIGDELTRKRAEIALVTFDDTINTIQDFISIEDFHPPTLSTSGATHMGEGILKAIEMVEHRKNNYKNEGIDYFRPWIFLITDGSPTDMNEGDSLWSTVIHSIHEGEKKGKFSFFAVGIEPMDMDTLKKIAPSTRPPILLKQGKFKEMFVWLSKSQQRVSGSKPGDQTELPPASGWGKIAT
jgi:uncharacterized protein YegL